MKKSVMKLFTIVLLFSFIASPAIAQTVYAEADRSTPPELTGQTRPEPELLPQEILDEFEGGMPIEEFLVRNQGPIPNALLDFADMPVTVIVLLEDPPLAEYVVQQELTRDASAQEAYVAQLERTQAGILGQITAGRSDVTLIGDTFTKVLNGFMLRLPASDLNQIREISGVKTVTLAPEHELNLSASVPLIGADQVWTDPGYTGKGITVAVIDTGIDYTHAMFGGPGTADAYAAIDPDIIQTDEFGVPVFPTTKVIGGYDFAGTLYHAGCPAADEAAGRCTRIPQPDPNPIDEHSHGTHVAATVAGKNIGFGPGVAPDAELYALKVFGRSGSTNLTLHAIEWAMDPKGLGNLTQPVDVINMSLGANWGVSDIDSPQHIAVENAAAIGVVVVASAGNAGNSSYIVGSPSTANSAISVAASSTGFSISSYIAYEYDSVTNYIPYNPTSLNPITTKMTADLIDVESLGVAVTFCNADVEALDGVPLDGDIALISRGACTFDEKINNAEKFGAVAAVVHNNAAGPFGMDTPNSTLPAAAILLSDGLVLKDLTPIEISIGPDSNVRTFVSADPPDTIANFSSRGPRGFDSKLKPEISAPGVAIFAADMGTGNLAYSSSGTSMAAPHVAGVAALMKEAHANWTSYDIKAAMMNTAVDLADAASAQIPRQGAGRVDALEAVNTSVVAFGDSRLISLSWGVIEIGEDDYTDTQMVTLRNFTATAQTFAVDAFFTSTSTGATMTPSVTEVTVPAFGDKQVAVTLDLDATLLPIAYLTLEEYYGFVTFENPGETLRVPFYFVPRPYTELTEVDAVTEFCENWYGFVELDQSGPVPSSLWAYPVTLVSPQNPNVLDAADLRYVGMDYGWDQPGFGDIFVPSFAMWGDAHTNQPFFNEVDLYIDTPYGSVVNFNYNLAWLQGLAGNNQWVVIQVDFADGWVGLGSPWLIYADYNSGFQEWYLPAAWQYVVDKFDYEVVSFDWYGNMDYGGAASFDISKPPLMWGLTAGLDPFDEAFSFLFAVDDLAGYLFSDIAGIMLVDYFGEPGAGQSYFWSLDIDGICDFAYLQLAHLAPFSEDASVTIEIDGAQNLRNINYGDSTRYIMLPAGEYDIVVIPTGTTDPAIEATVELEEDTYYTALAVGDGVNQDLELIALVDDLSEPAAGMFHLRLGHLAPFAAGPATADVRLKDGTPVLLDVDFGDVTDFILLPAGEYDLIITTPGGGTVLIDPVPVAFAEGDIISAFATGEGNNQPLGVFALPAGEVGFFLPLAVRLDHIIFFPLIFH